MLSDFIVRGTWKRSPQHPLEEVFLMEEILPAPLREVEATSLTHNRAMDLLRLPEQPVLSCNVGCGHPDPRPDYPSPLRMAAFCHGFSAASHALSLTPRAPDHWRYVGGPFNFQSFDLDACATRPTFHCQPEAPVLEFGAEDATVPDAFVGGGKDSDDEIEFIL